MQKMLLGLLLTLIASRGSSQKTDTTSIYFDLGISKLNSTATRVIDSLIYNDILLQAQKVGIIGYADYLGSERSNISLSEDRANAVLNYLLEMGINKEDIEMVIGKGEINRNKKRPEGYPGDRRVDIIPGGFVKSKKVAPGPLPVKPVEKPIDITQVKKNETIRLNNIYFLPGQHFVRDGSFPELEKLYQVMINNPTLSIQIEGHICCLYSNEYDGMDIDTGEPTLSVNRAKFIYDYLVDKGISKDKLKYAGYGISKPLRMPENTPEDENMNRRVEIRILSK